MESGAIFTAVIMLLVGVLVLVFGVSFIDGKNLKPKKKIQISEN